MTQWRRVFSDVSTSLQQSARVVAAGTSTAQCLPLSIASTACGTWLSQRVQMYTRSTSSRAQSAAEVASSVGAGWPLSATRSAADSARSAMAS